MGTHWLVMDDPGTPPVRRTAPGWPVPAGTACHAAHHGRTDGDHAPPHPHRPGTADRDPRAPGLGRRRGFLHPRHLGGARLPWPRRNRTPPSLDVVISCSITKFRGGLTQWLEPTMSGAVARAIGAHNAMTFDVSNACAGMLTGVTILNNWIRQGIVERGLVVSGEYISQLGHNAARHIRNIMSKELACLTLGDAGAALLLERAPAGSAGISLAGFTTVADYSRLCLAYPKGHDPGARMFTDSRAIQKAAIADTPLLLHEVLDAAGISIHDIDHVITHQTSARAIRKGMAAMSPSRSATARATTR